MNKLLEFLYDRYNQFNDYEYPIQNPNTLIRIFKEGCADRRSFEEKMHKYQFLKYDPESVDTYQELVADKNFVQPKSTMIRIHFLDLILNAIPDHFFVNLKMSKIEIVQITVAIAIYYLGLQTYKFGNKPISSTAYKNIIGREDFFIGLKEVRMVCGKVTQECFEYYIELFAKDINEITEDSKERLYLKDGRLFILNVQDFLDYIFYKVECVFKGNSSQQEYSKYTNVKGAAFEKMVYGFISNFFEEAYHTLFYYPKDKEKIEVDIVVRMKENLAVLECKSGTMWFDNANDNEAVKGTIKNGVKKAYKSLRKVANYCADSKEYCFKNDNTIITGIDQQPVCIHVSMYPIDFMASNIHTLFPEYVEGNSNPILTISFEHLCAILLDLRGKEKNIFDYWNLRKEDIVRYPGMQFDNNELDLYYELINGDINTMLAQLKELGLLDMIAPQAKIMSSFRNANGEEERPALFMLKELDSVLMAGLIEYGKSWLGINKRYLKNLEEFLRAEDY